VPDNQALTDAEVTDPSKPGEYAGSSSPRLQRGGGFDQDATKNGGRAADDSAKIAELTEAIEKFSGLKRWSDVIRATIHKAELMPDPAEKIALFVEAGRMCLERSSNQAEAIKCYQRVLGLDHGHAEAIAQLKDMYEKRRDWERLIDVLHIESEGLDPAARASRSIEIAQLATEKLRKPSVCIALWRNVLTAEPQNPQALAALSGLYERARDWAPLVEVLERQSALSASNIERTVLLQKLGGVYADKLQDDNAALHTYKRLLDLDPNDRRAQEQLKRRWVAAGAWDELETFYTGPDRTDELLRTLERASDNAAAELSERVALQFRLARLWEERKQAPERAARACEKVLSLDPENLEAAERLSAVYEQAGDAKKLAAMYEVRLKHDSDPELRTALLQKVGVLYEAKLDSPELAFERYIEAFSLSPQVRVLHEDVERLAAQVNGWERVFLAYARAIERTQAGSIGDAARSLRLDYGRALAAAGRTSAAIEQYAAVYAEHPDDVAALDALEHLYRSVGQYRQLRTILEHRLQLEREPDVRKRLAYDIAALWRDHLQDPERAIEAYRTIAHEFGEGESDAYSALDRLYEQQQRYPELAQTLERRITLGVQSQEELASLKFRLANVLRVQQRDAPRALSLYHEVLTLLPEHDGALAALRELSTDQTLGAEAAAILVDAYAARGDHAQLVAALEALGEFEQDPQKRVQQLERIAELRRDQLNDTKGAFDAYVRAFEAAPEDEQILSRLLVFARQSEQVPELMSLMDAHARAVSDPGLSRTLLLRTAQLHENELGDLDAAIDAYKTVLAHGADDAHVSRDSAEADNEAVLNELEQLYRRAERWQDLLSVLRQRAAQSSDPEFQESQLTQVGFIHDEMLSETDAAIQAYTEVLELNPHSRVALSALDTLYERKQQWAALADNVARQLPLAEDEGSQLGLMLRLGALRQTHLQDPGGAIEAYREVLARDPNDVTALGALERMLELPEHQNHVAEVLEPLYRDKGEYAKLIGVHDIQVKNCSSEDLRVNLLHRMAELYEVALDDLDSAFSTYGRALAEDPTSTMTRDELDRIAASEDRWRPLVDIYEKLASQNEDPAVLVHLHTRAAQIREDYLNDVPAASAHYERVLSVDPSNVEAVNALERSYQTTQQYEELAHVFWAKANLLSEPDAQREYLFRAATLQEEVLQRPDIATTIYERVLQVEADDLTALDKLAQLYKVQANWPKLLDVYTRTADVVSDPEEKKRLHLAMGKVHERELGQRDKAIEAYQRVLDLDPDETDALSRLDELYTADGRHEELLSVLEREAELSREAGLSPDEPETLDLRYRIGELYEQKLNDPFRAVEVYRDVLGCDPAHGSALAALERMISEGREEGFAASVLEPVYRAAPDSQRLAKVLEVLIRQDTEPARKVNRLHQVAELYEVHLDDTPAAFDALSRAFAVDPQDSLTLNSLARTAEKLGHWRELTALYDAAAELARAAAPETTVDLALRSARVFEEQLSDVPQAIARYSIVSEIDPQHAQTLEALARLHEGAEDWQALAEVLGRQVAVATSPDEILAIQFKLGQLEQHRNGHLSNAVNHYREILAAVPEHREAREALENLFAKDIEVGTISEILEPLYRMQGDWDRLIVVQQAALRVQSDPQERVLTMQRIAEIAEQKGSDSATAFVWLQRSLLEAPDDDYALRAAERLAGRLGSYDQLANTYASLAADERFSQEQRAAAATRLARVYMHELGDVVRAEETYRYVLGLAPDDDTALRALDAIYTEHNAPEPLVTVLKRRIALAHDFRDKVEFSQRLAKLLWHECQRVDEAALAYRSILDDLDATHEGALHGLQNIYAATGAWLELFQVYERELDTVSSDSAQAEILGRMAMLAATRLNDRPRAVELLRKVIELLGEDRDTLNALGNIYALDENWADLVDVLEREVAVTDVDVLRMQIYSDLGCIWYDKLHRDRNALESWERVLEIDPSNAEALQAIAHVHRTAENYDDLVQTLHRAVTTTTRGDKAALDASAREAIYMELGALYSQQLARPSDAVLSYNKVLEINPSNFSALDALEAIHCGSEQWTEAIDVKQRRVAALTDHREKIALLLDIARMSADKLGDPDQAVDPLTQVLELDPLHHFAYERLEQLHRAAGRFEALVALGLLRVEHAPDAHQRVLLLRNMARVYEQDLDDKGRAFDALLTAWTQDYADEESSRDVERMVGLTQRWDELLAKADQSLQALPPDDTKTRSAINLRIARWYSRQGRHDQALPYLQQVLVADSTHRQAMRQMAELYQKMQQWPAYAQALTRLVDMTEVPSERADALVALGDLQNQQFEQPDQAIGLYNQALDVVPDHLGGICALETLYRAREQWGELVAILRRKIDVLSDPEEVLQAKVALAEAYEERVADKGKAVEQYKRVLADDSTNLQALKGLERLYTQQEHWQDLMDVLERQMELVQNERDQVQLLTRMAGMWEQEFLKPDKAAEKLERVLEMDPLQTPALTGLSRLYRQQRKWSDLISVYERHIDASTDRAEQVQLYQQIGAVYRDETKDTERAIDSFLNALGLVPDDAPSLQALSQLYEARGDHAQALDVLSRLTQSLDDDADRAEKVRIYHHMGEVLAKQLGDRMAALEAYQAAADLDDAHMPAFDAMRSIHMDAGDYHAAARALTRMAAIEKNPRRSANILVELGDLYQDKLEEPPRAVECYEQAIALDGDNSAAALPLVREYAEQERWEQAEPLLQVLVRGVASRPVTEQRALWLLNGRCAEQLSDDDAAVRSFAKAYELDAQDLTALRGLAAAHYRKKSWDNAFKFYQQALVQHRDELSPAEKTDVRYRLGVIKREQGERKKALNLFEKALEEDLDHRPTLEALVALYEADQDYENVIHYKKRVLETVSAPDERFALIEELGDLWHERLKNPVKAIESYIAASELQPQDHKLLHKLLALYQSTQQWEPMIDILDRIAAIETRNEAKAKYAYTVGVITRDELKDIPSALTHFNAALDLDPLGMLKAFEAINKLLTQQKDWRGLERAFRKMLHRVTGKGDTALEFNLWHNLGVIYRDRQRNYEAAAESFAMASRLAPANMTEHRILAEIYELLPERLTEAVERQHILLRSDPEGPDAYHALYKLHMDHRQYDRAYCVAATLNFLHKSTEEQRQFYEQHKPEGPSHPRGRLTNELWVKDLLHPDEDFLTGKVFESITPALLRIRAQPDKRLSLNKKDLVPDLQLSPIAFANTFGFVTQVFNLAFAPRLFVCPERPGGLAFAVTQPPASVCGSGLLNGQNPVDVVFLVAKHLTYYRGEHYVRAMFQTKDELKMLLVAAMQISGVEIHDPIAFEWARQIRAQMQPADLELLSNVSKRFVDGGARTDIKRWMQCVELTACRAGLLLANDLEVAAHMIQAEPPVGATDVGPKEKLHELLLFSVSESYARLREALGIQINVVD